MRNILLQLLPGFFILLTSCGQVMSEVEAKEKNQQGVAQMNTGEYEKALLTFKQAIKNPALSAKTKAPIYRNIALTHLQMGQQDSSIAYSTLAAECYDKNTYEYFVNIADVTLLKGQTKKAITYLNKAYLLDANKLEANNSLGIIYLGDYGREFADPQKAIQYNKKAFELNRDRVTEDVLGRNYYELSDFKKAEFHYEKLQKEFPGIITYSLNLGMIKHKLKKTGEAETLFEKVLQADSSMINTINAFKEQNE